MDQPALRDRLRRAWGRLRVLARRVPLRVQLIGGLLALVIAALLATGIAGTHLLRGYLVSRVDSQLSSSAPLILQRLGGPGGDFGGGLDRFLAQDEYYAALAQPSVGALQGGFLQARHQSSPPSLTIRRLTANTDGYFSVGSKNNQIQWRVYAYAVPMTQGPGIFAVATPLTEVNNTVHRLVLIDVGVSAVVVLLLAGFGWLLVRASLRPLGGIEQTAEAIAAGDLSRRVEQGDARTEVGRLSLSLNGMLSQIESAFHAREESEANARESEDRMRRFVADASHELRTPLTSIRGFAELYRQGAVNAPEDLRRMMRRIEEEATRMGLLVEDLLLLARLDQQRPLERHPVDLLVLAADAVHDARAVQPDRPIELEVTADQPPVVIGDEARLRQVLGNLVTNALTHTPPSTRITVRLDTRPDAEGRRWALVGVADEGPGLHPEEAARVFERFYRADKSRTRAMGGSGLGLSIVAALVAAHHGRVDLTTAPGQGATFTIRLPLQASERGATLAPASAG